MTQSSLAITLDGDRWAIINASPDIRMQLAATPALRPRGLRGLPVAAVLLTSGDPDHVAGLFSLCWGAAFRLIATPAIHDDLVANPMPGALSPDLVVREVALADAPSDLLPGLAARLIPAPGKGASLLGGRDNADRRAGRADGFRGTLRRWNPRDLRADFEARLRAIGAERYHDKHPFHTLLHGGGVTSDQVRAWVLNRWYYQSRIPMKHAAFMSRVTTRLAPGLARASRTATAIPTRTASAAG